MNNKKYKLDQLISKLPLSTEKEFNNFWSEVETVEKKNGMVPIIFQDKKSGAFYIECHIRAKIVINFLDIDAALDPEEQKEYRINRELQPMHKAFLKMIEDAKAGRQFSDIIIEYNTTYKDNKPLKVLGGQHRAEAIRNAIEVGVDRPNGFKVYFSLSTNTRNEIAQISNTNIAISTDLIDRMEETLLRSGLRKWCQEVGLLSKKGDFADRKNSEGIITVRIARTFIVNFSKAKLINYDQEKNYLPYVCKTGDKEYKKLLKEKGGKLWQDKSLITIGKKFAELHKKQMEAIDKNKELKKIKEYRVKTITPVVTAAWSYVAGLAHPDQKKLKKILNINNLPNKDPLNADALTKARHHSDPETYRGIGARISNEELGRMTEVLIQYIESNKQSITPEIIDLALKIHFAKKATEDVVKAKRKLK